MKGAVCKRIYDELLAENEELKKYVKEVKIHLAFEEDMEELKREKEELTNDRDGWKRDCVLHIERNRETQSDLYKEIEKLKKFAIDVHNFAYGTKWDDTGIVSAMDFDAIVKKMKEDEKEQELDLFRADTSVYTAEGLSDKLREENKKLKECVERAQGDTSIFTATLYETKLKKEIESLTKSNKQKTKLIHKFREQVKTLEQRTMIYSILDETYKSMPKSKKEWIDVNWKSIINGFADNLEQMVPDEEDDDEE